MFQEEDYLLFTTDIIQEEQDLTYLKWSHIRNSSGTAGTFLKSESTLDGIKKYYKLSDFDQINGVVGHECVNEIIVDRLLNILKVDHIHYQLINAVIEIDGREYTTYLCCSEDFKKAGESKAALDNYYTVNHLIGESHYDFCVRMGWQKYIDVMLAVDYIILNRDRHGANIEVLRNPRLKTIRLAPLFDHGLSLMYSCITEQEVEQYDISEDKRCQNFIGGFSCYDNLSLIKERNLFEGKLNKKDKASIFEGLDKVLSKQHIDKLWDMIYSRYKTYEKL
ncbi:MAG: hypothetical protein IKO61_10480 [Lachnospiraceae bacterium]|nr:hypothetical protein [Lachnospiraceae bacterium]